MVFACIQSGDISAAQRFRKKFQFQDDDLNTWFDTVTRNVQEDGKGPNAFAHSQRIFERNASASLNNKTTDAWIPDWNYTFKDIAKGDFRKRESLVGYMKKGPYQPTPIGALIDDRLVIKDVELGLMCFDAVDGKLLWNKRKYWNLRKDYRNYDDIVLFNLFQDRRRLGSTLSVINDTVFHLDPMSQKRGFANRDLRKRYVLQAHNIRDGRVKWSSAKSPSLKDVNFRSTAIPYPGAVLAVGVDDKSLKLYAINPEKGSKLWEIKIRTTVNRNKVSIGGGIGPVRYVCVWRRTVYV